jgi:hypothetical protein
MKRGRDPVDTASVSGSDDCSDDDDVVDSCDAPEGDTDAVLTKKRQSIAREAGEAAAWFFSSSGRGTKAVSAAASQAPLQKWFFQAPQTARGSTSTPAVQQTRSRPTDGPRKSEPSKVGLLSGSGHGVVTAGDMTGKVVKFTNCRLVRGHCLVRDDLWIRDGVIIDPVSSTVAFLVPPWLRVGQWPVPFPSVAPVRLH